jgi:hypothetical protein
MEPETQQTPSTATTAPAEDTGFSSRKLPGIPAGESRGMLPGMAMIGIYMLLIAMLNAFASLRGSFGTGAARYGILGVSSILVVGVFGFLRLRRWGWAVLAAGCVLFASADFYMYTKAHAGFLLIRALFSFLFFLYLSRTEVRERLH